MSDLPGSPLKPNVLRRLSCSTPLTVPEIEGAANDVAAAWSGTSSSGAFPERLLSPALAISSSSSITANSNNNNSPTLPFHGDAVLFFNADASTRKVSVALPVSMAELRAAFAREMALDAASMPPLYIRDQFTSIEYELKSAADVYPLAFITIRVTSHHHLVHHPSSSTTTTTTATTDGGSHHANRASSSYLLESMVLRRQKLVIVFVGKPGNGKTFVAQKLARYLNWNGVPTQVFSIAERRRAKLGFRDASFYDPADEHAVLSRQSIALETLDAALAYLIGGGANTATTTTTTTTTANTTTTAAPRQGMAAIIDGNNITEARRAALLLRLKNGGVTPSEVLFLEITKPAGAPDVPDVREAELAYSEVLTPDEARSDLGRRMQFYSASYEPLPMERTVAAATRERPMLVQLCPEEHKLAMRDVRSYVAQRIVSLLMNVGTRKKKMWFSRHGESLFNLTGQLGGNSDLSEKGHSYAAALARWFADNVDQQTRERMIVVTSTLQRTISTARHFTCEKLALPALDEIDAGICDGMTYDGIAREYPEEAAARAADKYHYRYPRGESYVDVVQRLEPVLLELERVERPVLVISHQAIMRVLVSYFRDIAPEKIPHMDMPLHTLVEITPSVGSLQMKEHKLI